MNRETELDRLAAICSREEGGLAIVYGRKRVGKTRLLLEWVRQHSGLYVVADHSSPEVQRRYFAQAVAQRVPGFGDVEYPDWRALLSRFARESRAIGFRGPIVIDELPYLVNVSPELPSVLQALVDHDFREARLVMAVAGSSQRMMQGLALSREAPLYGRAVESLDLRPLGAEHMPGALEVSIDQVVLHYAAWGGIPRYWELAKDLAGSVESRIDRLVLDPLGPLHREPDRLLVEELPPATELRPVLDAIGAGAHRLSEIAARIGRPATSLARPLERLTTMGLVRRDVPFGEPARSSKRSLYRIDDPFFRLWFRVVAPHRARLVASPPADRVRLLAKFWPALVSQAWEELCRERVVHANPRSRLARRGPWGVCSPWWRANEPEWDLVAASEDGRRLLLGEAKWSARDVPTVKLERWAAELCSRPPPRSVVGSGKYEISRALFVPRAAAARPALDGVELVTLSDLFRAR